MFEMPSLRTDNFYKFIAGCGLLIVAAATVAPYVLDRQEPELSLRVRQNLTHGENDGDRKAHEDVFENTDADVSNFFEKKNEQEQIRNRRNLAFRKVWWGGVAVAVVSVALWRRVGWHRQIGPLGVPRY